MLRGRLHVSAVDQELINNHADFPDKFVARGHAQSAVQGHGVSGGGAAAAAAPANTAAGQSTANVAQFYLQVIADSFAKNLPSARRGVEQLGALAGMNARHVGEFNEKHRGKTLCLSSSPISVLETSCRRDL